jgi:hypothetical protein
VWRARECGGSHAQICSARDRGRRDVGNITVAVGTDGIMVDTQFAPLHDKIKAGIEKISPLPIKSIKYVMRTRREGPSNLRSRFPKSMRVR